MFLQSFIPLSALPQILTETSADVDVEVDAVVAVVHQIAIAHFDQRAEVVLLTVRVEHITGHLHRELGHHSYVHDRSVKNSLKLQNFIHRIKSRSIKQHLTL